MDGDPMRNFTIDPVNGRIRLTAPLDFEAIQMGGEDRFFNLTVQAYDLGTPSLSSTTQVLVYVADVNDHKPKFERSSYAVNISEDTPGGTSVLKVRKNHAFRSSLKFDPKVKSCHTSLITMISYPAGIHTSL